MSADAAAGDPGAAVDDWDAHWSEYADAVSDNPAEWMRFELLLRLLDLGDRPARILDIGSGQGDLVAALRARHPRAESLGLDLSRSGVEIASAKVPAARFVQRDLLDASEPGADLRAWATHATCSEVLEHVDDPALLLRNAAAYMAPGCRVAITVPGGPMSAFDRHIGHRRHFTPRLLSAVLEDAGYSLERVGGAGFPFFNLYRLAVVARGRRLIDEVATRPGKRASRTALLAMKAFAVLFRANLPAWRFGWQVVALARGPE